MTQKDYAERAAFDREVGCTISDAATRGIAWMAWQARAALDASAEPVAQWQRRMKSPGYDWENCTEQTALDCSNIDYWEVRALFTRPDADKRDAETRRDDAIAEFIADTEAGTLDVKAFKAGYDAALSQASKGNGNG